MTLSCSKSNHQIVATFITPSSAVSMFQCCRFHLQCHSEAINEYPVTSDGVGLFASFKLQLHTQITPLLPALGLDDPAKPSPLIGRLLLVEDCVETSGAFLLHHLLKRSLSSPQSSNAVIFIAFSQSFAHYDRVLRKLGCNLVAQRDSGRFIFFDMLTLGCSDRSGKETDEGVLVGLYCKIQRAVNALIQQNKKHVTIVIDDIPLLEVAANGSSNHVLDFLHYCHTLTSEIGCSLIALNHEDVYMDTERPRILQMEYLADVLIKVGPLATGIAKDVHGQLTVLNKPVGGLQDNLRNRVRNFQFYIKENGTEFFYSGSRT